MKHFLKFGLAILLSTANYSSIWAQGSLKGTIKNSSTGETLIGASVLYGPGKGTVTDIDGNYLIKELADGDYTITFSYVGFKSSTQKIKIAGKPVTINARYFCRLYVKCF